MPKMRSHSGAKKSFSVTASGRIKRGQQGKNHILTKKSSKRKMALRQGAYMGSDKEAATIKNMIQK